MTKHTGRTGRFGRLDFEEKPLAATAQPLEDAWPNLDDQGCLRQGDTQFQNGLYEPALNAYSRALRFNRDLVAAWVGQIRCLICMGEYPEAVTWSDRALERFSKSPDLLACKGLALVLMGETAEGTEYLDGAVEMRAPSAWVWLARGESLLVARQPEANARRCFLKALELSPQDWHLELRIGMAYNGVRLFAQAREHLLAAGRIEKNNALVFYHLGLAQESLGEFQAAGGLYQRALALRRDFREAEEALSRVQNPGVFFQVLATIEEIVDTKWRRNNMAEELEVEIDAAGQVHVVTKGIKGKRCLDYVEIFRQLLGPVTEQNLTPEYNQVETHSEAETQTHVQQKVHRL